MRADTTTKGSIGRELIFNVKDGQISYDHNTFTLSEEKNKRTSPSFQHSSLTHKEKGVIKAPDRPVSRAFAV
eukprot:3387608-Pyramimonas_sp.AAC.1